MTLTRVILSTLTCDGCDVIRISGKDTFGNPRFDALQEGWRNGSRKTLRPRTRQYKLDLCPECVEEGTTIKQGVVYYK